MPTIDIVLPTYNRADRLQLALQSLAETTLPDHYDIVLTVVDNNSSDNTKAVIEHFADNARSIQVNYLFEGRQGRQFALNTGISAGRGEIVAMFDDDEKLDPRWLQTIAREFEDPEVDYIAGPCRPDWQIPPPPWLPSQGVGGTLGIIDHGTERRRYGDTGFNVLPTGGNIAIRRDMLNRCGPYASEITYAEDRYMYERLRANGAVGYYVPDLAISHFIPASRLEKNYFRRWAYTEGVNLAKLDRRRDKKRAMIFGLPLWRWRQLLRALMVTLGATLTGKSNDPIYLERQLEAILIAGYLIERNSLANHRYNDRSRTS